MKLKDKIIKWLLTKLGYCDYMLPPARVTFIHKDVIPIAIKKIISKYDLDYDREEVIEYVKQQLACDLGHDLSSSNLIKYEIMNLPDGSVEISAKIYIASD